MNLRNYVCGEWKEGQGAGDILTDPVTGEELARVSSQGVSWDETLAFARARGGASLRKLSYRERADLLAKMADCLAANRDEYFRISLLNSGATQADASFDVDGAIYTVKYYAKIGRGLGEGLLLREGAGIPLSKNNSFAAQHFLEPAKGAAIFINAFNFPAWGWCEKAAPALLSGVPIVIKPASPTAWLTQRMVEDVVKAGILPPGAISIVCGSAREMLDHVREADIISFTGSAETAAKIRGHENVLRRGIRVNVEADSINSAIMGSDVASGSGLFDLFTKEVVREMTLKAGQKCTAIRRIFVPRSQMQALGDAIATQLGAIKVGNPRNPEVKVGPVVNRAQQSACLEGISKLRQECSVLFGGDDQFQPLDADRQVSAFVQPTLLACSDAATAKFVHSVEVFGPVATLIPYDGGEDLIAAVRKGEGSLVASIFSDDAAFTQSIVLGIGDLHGRIMVVDSSVGMQFTGHGNVVPSCLHGGPGRAGGGEELAGLRALLLYHRRFVVQGPPSIIAEVANLCSDAGLIYS